MRSQKHNLGKLRELKVNIEEDVVDSFERMAKNSGICIEDLVVTALKRFRACHSDYEGKTPELESFE